MLGKYEYIEVKEFMRQYKNIQSKEERKKQIAQNGEITQIRSDVKYIGSEELAEILNIPRKTVLKMLCRGDFKTAGAFKAGREWRIPVKNRNEELSNVL